MHLINHDLTDSARMLKSLAHPEINFKIAI